MNFVHVSPRSRAPRVGMYVKFDLRSFVSTPPFDQIPRSKVSRGVIVEGCNCELEENWAVIEPGFVLLIPLTRNETFYLKLREPRERFNIIRAYHFHAIISRGLSQQRDIFGNELTAEQPAGLVGEGENRAENAADRS